jgi:TldD protein
MSDLTRRSFLKLSGKGLVVASIPALFKVNPLLALSSPLLNNNPSDYYEHFGVDETVIRKVMSAALAKGGDYCDVYFQHTISNSIGLEDDVVNKAYTSVDLGVGIRVLEGEQTGYSYTEELTPNSMINAAKTAANIAGQSETAAPSELTYQKSPNYYQIEVLWEDVSIDQKIPYLQKINSRMQSRDKRIIKTRVWFQDQSTYRLFIASDGRVRCDYQPMVNLYAICTAEQNGKREKNSKSLSVCQGLEYISDDVLNDLADEAVRKTVLLFDAVNPGAGEMEVVLAAGGSGILLHEAIGHGMEADFNRKGESIFSDKIGKPVAEKFVSIVDDGTNKHVRGSLNFDDEGNATEKTYLVKDGILLSYMHDHISSKFYKVKPTGNGRRQSFRYSPLPRMRNTYMLNGPHKREEIIKSVKKGLYAESFNNGEVHIGPGDFTFYLNTGYMIENGKLTNPVKDINIIGNGPEVLRRIVMVADDFKLSESGGACGKGGQSVPVSMGLPTVKVSAITVGGVNS